MNDGRELSNEKPHRRFNPLSGDWVLVSPHRSTRPWDGQLESADTEAPSAYLPDCYLCPTNVRAGGQQNPDYETTHVFTNDFAALLPDPSTSHDADPDGLLISEPERGICRVICYSPRHDLSLARMTPAQVEPIITTWIDEYCSLGSRDFINHVQIFENRGLIMGCSNPHPHGQIWASSTVPNLPARELEQQQRYLEDHGSCLLCAYLSRERSAGERILFENESFVVLVPYWAFWPFETMIIPRRHCGSIDAVTEKEKKDLAAVMVELGICYDNLFQTSFPYSMGIHQRPTDGGDYPGVHFHFHYLPPLLRSQTIKKHMVGFELLATVQRDLSPEIAAARLRELPRTHYLEGRKQP